jgi:hypothetical protein
MEGQVDIREQVFLGHAANVALRGRDVGRKAPILLVGIEGVPSGCAPRNAVKTFPAISGL